MDISQSLVDEELLEALDDVDTGEQSTLITSDGETELPPEDSEEEQIQLEDGETQVEGGETQLEDAPEDAELGEDEPEPGSMEVAPAEEG